MEDTNLRLYCTYGLEMFGGEFGVYTESLELAKTKLAEALSTQMMLINPMPPMLVFREASAELREWLEAEWHVRISTRGGNKIKVNGGWIVCGPVPGETDYVPVAGARQFRLLSSLEKASSIPMHLMENKPNG